MKVAIIYDSITNNTASLAFAINEAVKDLCSVCYFGSVADYKSEHADLYFIGSWTTKGMCSLQIQDLIKSLKNKQICYFGTCGYGNSIEYYSKISDKVKTLVDETSVYKDYFISQGKMKKEFYPKYLEVVTTYFSYTKDDADRIFNEALLRPDKQDIDNVCLFALKNIN